MKRILLIAVLLGTMITATTYFVCIAAPSVLFGKGIKAAATSSRAPSTPRISTVWMRHAP